jgi:phenylpropionate dioxygenase-like ring-hydroxylating dioxygenase large terminal subunit
MSDLLTECWYVASHSAALAKGGMLPITLRGEEILLLRDNYGTVSALRDFCPHRGIPLRYGKFDGLEVECCYHGWCFNTGGQCTKIPSLAEEGKEKKTDLGKIRTRAYPARELDGVIWVYSGDSATPGEPPMLPARVPGGLRHVASVTFTCNIDHAVIGLMDPSHGPFVHKSWWWRTKKSMHVKEKHFAPREFGFAMVSHKPSSNSRAYKILGGSGERSTEIAFRLPGLRTEHIRVGRKQVVLLTALTPVDAQTTVLHQFMGTDIGLLNALRPLLLPFGKAFIEQDRVTVIRQQEGLANNPDQTLMLLGDADAQALWYYRLKKEWLAAQTDGRPFENPLKERLLRWRS